MSIIHRVNTSYLTCTLRSLQHTHTHTHTPSLAVINFTESLIDCSCIHSGNHWPVWNLSSFANSQRDKRSLHVQARDGAYPTSVVYLSRIFLTMWSGEFYDRLRTKNMAEVRRASKERKGETRCNRTLRNENFQFSIFHFGIDEKYQTPCGKAYAKSAN